MTRDTDLYDFAGDNKTKYIVFFDGQCGLCNKFVQSLIKNDKNRKFKYSPLQGQYLKSLNVKIENNNLDTVYIYDGKFFYSKSEAVKYLLYEIGGFFKILYYISNMFPMFFLDFVYDFVAKNRYKYFGRSASCKVLNLSHPGLFLE